MKKNKTVTQLEIPVKSEPPGRFKTSQNRTREDANTALER